MTYNCMIVVWLTLETIDQSKLTLVTTQLRRKTALEKERIHNFIFNWKTSGLIQRIEVRKMYIVQKYSEKVNFTKICEK